MEKALTPKELEEHLTKDYETWKSIYEKGCSDPSFPDGVNLNLVRNHIIYGKIQCEKTLGDNLHLYPDPYFFPIPMELPNDFMVATRGLACLLKFLQASEKLPYNEVMKFDWESLLT